MSKSKLSELVAKKTGDTQRQADQSTKTPETAIPAVDAVQGDNTAIQKTQKYKEIDPARCKPWAHHNRPAVWFTPEACGSLIDSIKQEGQQELGLVREVRGEAGIDYEVIFGMRRWYATSQIDGAKFKARVTDANDQDCALLMHVENEESEDISEFEKGLSYEELIRANVFPTQTALAESLRVKKPYISKLLRAAKIFSVEEVRELLQPYTRELSVQKATDIQAMLEDKKSRDKVISKAFELGSEEGTGLATLLAELKAASVTKAKPTTKDTCHFKYGKKQLLTTSTKPNGKGVLTMEPDFVQRAGDKAESILTDAVKGLLVANAES